MSGACPVTRLDEDVWLVRGLPEARRVLGADHAFRAPQTTEFVPGFSRSFFLATDTGTAADRGRFRTALAAAVAPQRTERLATEVMAPRARHLAALVAAQPAFDVLDDYVRPFTRQVSYHLSGLPDAQAAELGARLSVAAELAGEDPAAVRSLVAGVWQQIREVAERGGLDGNGIAGFALRRGLISVDEAPLLTIPVLEMAALDMSGALTLTAVTRVADLPAEEQRRLAGARECRAAVWEAARRLGDIYITRVATCANTLGSARIASGDRLLIDVPAANSDEREVADHLAFGHGAHACMGRELALTTAVVGLRELLRHGTLDPVPDGGSGTLRLRPRIGVVDE